MYDNPSFNGKNSDEDPCKDFYKILSRAMKGGENRAQFLSENRSIPAGYTYLGQLIAHDISVHREMGVHSPPLLRLNSLYGFGPQKSAHLYDYFPENSPNYKYCGVTFRLWEGKKAGDSQKYDFERIEYDSFRLYNKNKDESRKILIPVIGDIRNDENFIISQLHLAFMRFHNKLAVYLSKREGWKNRKLFAETQKRVVWLYQEIILNDYLPKLVGKQIIEKLRKGPRNFIFPQRALRHLMPVFSMAAFRVGHSQIRNFYKLSNDKDWERIFLVADRSYPDLRGNIRFLKRPLEWEHFFELKSSKSQPTKPQLSNKLDYKIAPRLTIFPRLGQPRVNLIRINLVTGRRQTVDKLKDRLKVSKKSIVRTPETILKESIKNWKFNINAELKGGALHDLVHCFESKCNNVNEVKKLKSNLATLGFPKKEIIKVSDLANLIRKFIRRNFDINKESWLESKRIVELIMRKSEIDKTSKLIQKLKNTLKNGDNGTITLEEKLPLWFYILFEAFLEKEGEQLGRVGQHIIGEQIISVLKNDPKSNWNHPRLYTEMKSHKEGIKAILSDKDLT